MELAVVTALTEVFFMQDWQLAVLAGFLIAAVSPSVILPIMLNQKDVGVGGPRYIPDRIIGQTVINAFIAQTGILLMLEAIAPKPNSPEIWQILALSPLAVVGGAAVGIAAGWFLPLAPLVGSPRSDDSRVPRLRIAAWIVLALALAVYFTCSEFRLESVFATLAFGVILLRRFAWCEPVFRTELKKIWGAAEVILFVNLGSAIDLDQLVNPGLILGLLGIIGAAMGVRLVVAFLLTLRTSLVPKERRYITAANIPKATIQAVFGALPLLIFQQWRPDLVPQGQTLLIMAVLAIVSTAPVGAFLLEQWGPRGGKGSRQREMGDGHKKINELTVIAD
jgi:NhaP-type Na+/H+ or K+/H+ antiporter